MVSTGLVAALALFFVFAGFAPVGATYRAYSVTVGTGCHIVTLLTRLGRNPLESTKSGLAESPFGVEVKLGHLSTRVLP
jgi:hypothetical protein